MVGLGGLLVRFLVSSGLPIALFVVVISKNLSLGAWVA
jgi:hypothetical protein